MKRSVLIKTLSAAAFAFGLFFAWSATAQSQGAAAIQKPQPVKLQPVTPPPMTDQAKAAVVVPSTINYQGKLTNTAGAPITVATSVEFSIYDGPGLAALLLWGPQIEAALTPDADGFYNVSLGTGPAFSVGLFDAIPRYLGVKVTTEVAEMTPRQEITSVAYAINADRLGGLTSGDYVKKAGDVMTGELGVLSGPFGVTAFSADAASFFVGATPGPFSKLSAVGSGAYTNSKFSALDFFEGPANGATDSRAIIGEADLGTTSNIGVHGVAFGSAPGVLNYGLVGSAGSGTENWSGYFTDAPVRVGAGGLGGVGTATGAGDLYVADCLEVDGCVDLPASSIPSTVTSDEPGISHDYNSGQTVLGASASYATTSITVPTSGYIVVTAQASFFLDHTLATQELIRMWISTVAADGIDFNNAALMRNNGQTPTNTGFDEFIVLNCTKVEAVGAGLHTYHLNADKFSGGTCSILRIHLTAMFFPTAYGTVISTVASKPGAGAVDAATGEGPVGARPDGAKDEKP